MLNIKPKQTTFVYGQDIYKLMIPEDHILRKANKVIDFSRVNEICKDLYSKNTGRPVTNTPERMIRASFIEFLYDLRDRPLADFVNLNLAAREFVGLNLDEEMFHFEALSEFRLKLGEERFKVIFNDIIEQAYEKGLMARNEDQFMDATHIVGDIAIPTTIHLIEDYLTMILVMIFSLIPQLNQLIPLELKPYTDHNRPQFPKEYGLSEEKRKERLCQSTDAAIKLLNWYETFDTKTKELLGEPVQQKIAELNQILHDYLERKRERGRPAKGKDNLLEGNGEVNEREKKGEDRTVSSHDPDARHGAKSKTKHFTGYKANISQNESGIILSSETVPGNVNEEELLIPQLDDMDQRGINPNKVTTDGLYGSIDNRMDAEERGILLNAPVKKETNPTGLFPSSSFKFSDTTVTCPGNKEGNIINVSDERKYYAFTETDCQNCPLKQQCTKTKRRRVSISIHHDIIKRAQQYQTTAEYQQDKNDRTAVERTFSVGKGVYGLARARYRGRARVAIQSFLTFMVINVKRLIGLFEKKMKSSAPAATTG
jgi:transposase